MAQEKSIRKKKYQETLLKEINTIFRTHIKDGRLKFVSITKVEVSSDLSHAKVYWDTFDESTRGDAKAAIGKVQGKVRALLGERISVRHIPTLKFVYDSQYDSEKKISEILASEAKIGKN